MKNLFFIGEVLWISDNGIKYPIKIIDFKINNYDILYTFCSARDDAIRDEHGRKDNYFETEAALMEKTIYHEKK